MKIIRNSRSYSSKAIESEITDFSDFENYLSASEARRFCLVDEILCGKVNNG